MHSFFEWERKQEQLKKERPIWYFVHRSLPRETRRLKGRMRDVYYWFVHRTLDRYNVIRCDGLRPGYYDKDTQMFHAMFGLLRDFVEGELGWMHRICQDLPIPWWTRVPGTRFRNREDGLAYLDWGMKLKWDEDHGTYPGDTLYEQPTYQAIAYKEIKELYLWYADQWPHRPNPMDASGWSDVCDRQRAGEIVPEDEQSEKALLADKIETEQDDEDSIMLKRLIDVRGALWT